MVKEALGYVLLNLWLKYVSVNSGNPRLDLYRKADLLSQIMEIFAESEGELPEGSSKIRNIIRIIREYKEIEQDIRETNYFSYVKQVIPPFYYMLVEAEGIVPWGFFEAKIFLENHELLNLGLKPHVEEVRKVDALHCTIHEVQYFNTVKVKGKKVEYHGTEISYERFVNVLSKISGKKIKSFNILNWDKVRTIGGSVDSLKEGFKVCEVNSKGAVIRKTTELTVGSAMEILDQYANALMVEAVRRKLVGKKILEGIYGGEKPYVNIVKTHYEGSEV